MDFDQTQALPLDDYFDSEEEEPTEEKNPVAYLKVLSQKGLPERLFPLHKGVNIIGRNENCDIYIPEKALSKEHACIEIKGENHLIFDKNSRNKTRKGKLFLTPEVHYNLEDSQELVFADIHCVYIIDKDKKFADGDLLETLPLPSLIKPELHCLTNVDPGENDDESSNASSDLLGEATEVYKGNLIESEDNKIIQVPKNKDERKLSEENNETDDDLDTSSSESSAPVKRPVGRPRKNQGSTKKGRNINQLLMTAPEEVEKHGQRIRFSINLKLAIVEHAKKFGMNTTARKFGTHRKNIYRWMREDLTAVRNGKFGNKSGQGRKLSYPPSFDIELVQWVKDQNDQKNTISINLLRDKALEIIKPFSPSFQASSGWVSKFLNRHELVRDAITYYFNPKEEERPYIFHSTKRAGRPRKNTPQKLSFDLSSPIRLQINGIPLDISDLNLPKFEDIDFNVSTKSENLEVELSTTKGPFKNSQSLFDKKKIKKFEINSCSRNKNITANKSNTNIIVSLDKNQNNISSSNKRKSVGKKVIGRPKKTAKSSISILSSDISKPLLTSINNDNCSNLIQPLSTQTVKPIPQKKGMQCRRARSLDEKQAVVAFARKNGTNAAAHKFKIHRKNVYRWMREEMPLCVKTLSQTGPGRKLSYPLELDEQLVEWILERREQDLPVTIPLLQKQACSLIQPHVSSFQASYGWVRHFKKRHDFVFRALHLTGDETLENQNFI